MAVNRDRLSALAVPLGLLVLAALLRLPDLATRGTWDGDQGHDMLALRALVRDGVWPLLGPPTSIGDVHHGALYYYLLAPAAALTGGDSPLAVVFMIALAGIAAVAVAWWLGQAIAGPVAGLVAGLAMAISPATIDESTFIWNPNLIGLASAVALAGAWRAWDTRRPVWWLLAAAGTAVTMQCHVLGVTLLPIVGALLVADIRRRPGGQERQAAVLTGLGSLGLIALSFLPLVIHELTTDFGELRAAIAYVAGGGDSTAQGPLGRLVVIGMRVVSWPLIGLIADAFAAAAVALVAVAAIVAWQSILGHGALRTAARWLGLGLAWTALALTFASPSLATVIRELPNDHYHAFADPMVLVLIGIAAAALWRLASPGRIVALVGVMAIIGWSATHLPPAVHRDGGYPAAAAAAVRIEAAAGPGPIQLRGLPDFKSVAAYAYPLVQGGRSLVTGERVSSATLLLRDPAIGAPVTATASADPGTLVVICDRLFEVAIGAACGGPAEAGIVPADLGDPIDRFEAAPGRIISVYRAAGP